MSNSMALKIHQILQCLHTFPVGEMQHRVAEFCYCVCLYKNTHSIKVAQKSTRVGSTGNVFLFHAKQQNHWSISFTTFSYTLLYAFIRFSYAFHTLSYAFHILSYAFLCFNTHSNASICFSTEIEVTMIKKAMSGSKLTLSKLKCNS